MLPTRALSFLLCSRHLRFVALAVKESYCLREPECVRAELGRGARPGLASFQVLTRTLRDMGVSYMYPHFDLWTAI